jgi:hypothetical protein
MHDAIVSVMVEGGHSAGIPVIGGFNNTVRDMFVNKIGPNMHESEDDRRRRQGIEPDLLITGTTLPPDAETALPGNCLVGRKTVGDTKTVAAGQIYSQFPNDVPQAAVSKRQLRVNREYHRHAHDLDMAHNGTAADEVGPVEAELNLYGENGRVCGFAIGHFGEVSSDVYQLRDLYAYGHAKALTARINMPLSDAMAIYSSKISRLWGLLIARGWARILLGRLNLIERGGANNRTAAYDNNHAAYGGFVSPDADQYEGRAPRHNTYRHRNGGEGGGG